MTAWAKGTTLRPTDSNNCLGAARNRRFGPVMPSQARWCGRFRVIRHRHHTPRTFPPLLGSETPDRADETTPSFPERVWT